MPAPLIDGKKGEKNGMGIAWRYQAGTFEIKIGVGLFLYSAMQTPAICRC